MTSIRVWCAGIAHKGSISFTGTSAVANTQLVRAVNAATCKEYQHLALVQQEDSASLDKHADALLKHTYVRWTNARDAHPATKRVMTIVKMSYASTPLVPSV